MPRFDSVHLQANRCIQTQKKFVLIVYPSVLALEDSHRTRVQTVRTRLLLQRTALRATEGR